MAKSHRFSVRLLKRNWTIKGSLKSHRARDVDGKKVQQKINLQLILDNDKMEAYLDQNDSYSYSPWWVGFLGVSGLESVKSRAIPSCILFLKLKNGRVLAYSFGNGYNLLRTESIEESFGLNVTLNVIDGEEIKSLNIYSPSDNTKQKQEVSSILTKVNNFDFNDSKDLVEKLSGIIKEKYKKYFFAPTGKDSLSIKSDVGLEQLEEISEVLFKRFESEDYKKDDNLKDINKISKATDLERDELYKKLFGKINDGDFSNIFLADYEVVNPENFYTYQFGRKKFHNLDIGEFKEVDFSDNKIFDRKILVKKCEDDSYPLKWSLKKCLVADGEIKDDRGTVKKFFLSKGIWYHVEDDFISEVEEKIKKYKLEDINKLGLSVYKKDYKNKKVVGKKQDGSDLEEYGEGLYNFENTDGVNKFLFDKKTIRIKNNPLEICDIYDKNENIFFHIKRKNSSSSLSHLWNQGLVSERVAKVESSSCEEEKKYHGKFEEICGCSLPNNRKVYFGIISNSKDLPIFSKISFMEHVYNFKSMGCDEKNIKYFYINDENK
ncbi:MAG: TIGR04141 family sporadically distributed protein [Alphaproteobacteria bacterium]|jgi:uncharacterized protein (TIGR04141 family)|nr:TIGR04141 family sporadically distributed protein [Alphaproteobacteria bacterium]